MSYLLTFFKEFTFDTLIALTSCLAAIIALFLGGKVYHSYKKSNKYGGKKVMRDGSDDHSQQAENITNVYGLDTASSTALINFTRETFKGFMDSFYEHFDRQQNANMQTIIELTNRIIQDKKLELASYSKIDWINIYFESAKNSSDEFMQNVWAKVLAKELSHPDSFSYKSLDILKNMAAKDFDLFQKLCSMQVDGYVLKDELTKQNGLSWVEHLRLRDNSLLNLNYTDQILTIPPHETTPIKYQDKLLILIFNDSDTECKIRCAIYPLSSFGLELVKVAETTYMEDYFISFARCLKTKIGKNCKITLHRINFIMDGEIDYDENNLLEE